MPVRPDNTPPAKAQPKEEVQETPAAQTEAQKDSDQTHIYEPYTEQQLMDMDTDKIGAILLQKYNIDANNFQGRNTNKKLRDLLLSQQEIYIKGGTPLPFGIMPGASTPATGRVQTSEPNKSAEPKKVPEGEQLMAATLQGNDLKVGYWGEAKVSTGNYENMTFGARVDLPLEQEEGESIGDAVERTMKEARKLVIGQINSDMEQIRNGGKVNP